MPSRPQDREQTRDQTGDQTVRPLLLYSVKRLELAIRAHLDAMLRGSGVTTLQYTSLTVLEHRDGVSAAQLARDSFVSPQSMAQMLGALELRGLIERRVNPSSRRELLVHLTDAGRHLVERYAETAAAIEDRMTASFAGPEDAERFHASLLSGWSSLQG